MGNRPQGLNDAGQNAVLLNELKGGVNQFVNTSKEILGAMDLQNTSKPNGP